MVLGLDPTRSSLVLTGFYSVLEASLRLALMRDGWDRKGWLWPGEGSTLLFPADRLHFTFLINTNIFAPCLAQVQSLQLSGPGGP